MVYDSTKNHVGDAHWQQSGDFEGVDELRLQNGIMVEVGEKRRTTQTDLRVLFERKDKDRGSSAGLRSSNVVDEDGGPSSSVSIRYSSTNNANTRPPALARQSPSQRPKHKSLNAILNNRQTGVAYGRVTAQELPFGRITRLAGGTKNERSVKKILVKNPSRTSVAHLVDLNTDMDDDTPLNSSITKTSDLRSTTKQVERAPGKAPPKLPPLKQSGNLDTLVAGVLGTDSASSSSEAVSARIDSTPKERNPRAKALIMPKLNKRPKLVCIDSAVQAMGISLPPGPVNKRPLLEPMPFPDSDHLEDLNSMSETRRLMEPKKNLFKKPKVPSRTSPKLPGRPPRTSLDAIGSTATPSRAKSSLRKSNSQLVPSPSLAFEADPPPGQRTVPAATSKHLTLKKSASFDPVVYTLTQIHAQGADMGPWSVEAGDLFDWKPADWEARRGKITSTVEGVD
jgi:hypothetical protein